VHQAYLAPTYALIRDIFYPKIEDFLNELNIKHKINKAESIVHIEGLGNVFCRSMDDPAKIIGWECGDAFLDEFDTLPLDKAMHVFRKISARLRKKKPNNDINRLYVTTTPEGFRATYHLFVKNPLENSHLVKMSTYSNEHNLPDGYIDELKAQYPSQLIEAYINGEFVNLTAGTVYYAFDRKIHLHNEKPNLKETVHLGMDFNVHDMCSSLGIIRYDGQSNSQVNQQNQTNRNRIIRITDTFFGLRDTPDMIDVVIEKYGTSRIIAYPDASGRGTSSKSASLSDIRLLKEAGFAIKAPKKNPLIKNRVAAVNKAFEDGHLLIHEDELELIEALEHQVYNENTGQPEKDGYLDNRLDGLGYLTHQIFPIRKGTILADELRGY